MQRILLLLSLVVCTANLQAAISLVNHASGTSSTLTVTSTTAGNAISIITSSTSVPASVKLGTQTATQMGQCSLANSGIVTCAYYITSATGSQTGVTCTTCGTINFMTEGEWSGVSGVDMVTACYASGTELCQQTSMDSGAASILGLAYTPGYSSEGIAFGATCSASTGTPTTSGLTGAVTATPNGNAAAWGVSSAGGTTTYAVPTTGCGEMSGIAIGLIASGSTKSPVAQPNYSDQSSEVTTGSATVTAHVENSGDLVLVAAMCVPGCTTGTTTLGSQNITFPSDAKGSSSSNTGQPYIGYVITNTSGALTLTFTPSGSPTKWQISYIDFSVSAGTTVTYDKGAAAICDSACSEGSTITQPSITPTHTGSLLFNYAETFTHTTGPNSPWGCYMGIGGAALQGDCTVLTSRNLMSWVLQSSSGATSANVSILNANDPWQSVTAAFQLASGSGGIVYMMPVVY